MKQELLALLCCPESHSTLAPIDDALRDKINAAVRAGRLVNRAGKGIDHPIDSGLIRAEGDVVYPVTDEIPVLLRDEGIPLEHVR
jgi:uncharacterized protein YbaR (Trm112 family)